MSAKPPNGHARAPHEHKGYVPLPLPVQAALEALGTYPADLGSPGDQEVDRRRRQGDPILLSTFYPSTRRAAEIEEGEDVDIVPEDPLDKPVSPREIAKWFRPSLRTGECWHPATTPPEQSGVFWVRLHHQKPANGQPGAKGTAWWSTVTSSWATVRGEIQPISWASDISDADGLPFGHQLANLLPQQSLRALAGVLDISVRTLGQCLRKGCPQSLDGAKEWLAANPSEIAASGLGALAKAMGIHRVTLRRYIRKEGCPTDLAGARKWKAKYHPDRTTPTLAELAQGVGRPVGQIMTLIYSHRAPRDSVASLRAWMAARK